jgi:hypothetical protein
VLQAAVHTLQVAVAASGDETAAVEFSLAGTRAAAHIRQSELHDMITALQLQLKARDDSSHAASAENNALKYDNTALRAQLKARDESDVALEQQLLGALDAVPAVTDGASKVQRYVASLLHEISALRAQLKAREQSDLALQQQQQVEAAAAVPDATDAKAKGQSAGTMKYYIALMIVLCFIIVCVQSWKNSNFEQWQLQWQ